MQRYFVIHPSGQRYGPADVPTLAQWVTEGRIVATSLLCEELSGRQLQAFQVPGLNFSQGHPGPGVQNQPPYGQVQMPYTPPGSQNPGPYNPGPYNPSGPQGMAQPTIPYSVTGNPYGPQGNPYGSPSPHMPYMMPPADGTTELNNANILAAVALGLALFACCIPFGEFISLLPASPA